MLPWRRHGQSDPQCRWAHRRLEHRKCAGLLLRHRELRATVAGVTPIPEEMLLRDLRGTVHHLGVGLVHLRPVRVA